jgi:hypothetical protein
VLDRDLRLRHLSFHSAESIAKRLIARDIRDRCIMMPRT